MGFFTAIGIIVCSIAGIVAAVTVAVAAGILTYYFVKAPLTNLAERLKRRFARHPEVTVELRDGDEGDY